MLLMMIISTAGLLACQSSCKPCWGWLRIIPHFKLSWTKHTTLSLCMSTKTHTHTHKYKGLFWQSTRCQINLLFIKGTHHWPLLSADDVFLLPEQNMFLSPSQASQWQTCKAMGKLRMSLDRNFGSPDQAWLEGKRVNTAPSCLPELIKHRNKFEHVLNRHVTVCFFSMVGNNKTQICTQ